MTVIIGREYYTLYMMANHQLLGAEITLFHWHQTAEASLFPYTLYLHRPVVNRPLSVVLLR